MVLYTGIPEKGFKLDRNYMVNKTVFLIVPFIKLDTRYCVLLCCGSTSLQNRKKIKQINEIPPQTKRIIIKTIIIDSYKIDKCLDRNTYIVWRFFSHGNYNFTQKFLYLISNFIMAQ